MTRWVCLSCHRQRQSGVDLQPTLLEGVKQGQCPFEGTRQMFHVLNEAGPLDVHEGERRKDTGQALAARGTWDVREGWTARFNQAIRQLRSGAALTSETVTAIVGMPPAGSPSRVGALMTAAAKRGEIVKTGRMVKAERPNQHAAMLTEWMRT